MRQRLASFWQAAWPFVVTLAVRMVVALVFYTAFTVHSHNGSLDCMKRGFDQVLNELLHHAQITAPPDC